MKNLLIRYPFDKTGSSPDNFIQDEPHILQDGPFKRLFVPTYAPFYVESIVITDKTTSNTLTPDQYEIKYFQEPIQSETGKEVATTIIIKDDTISNNLSISYQTVGGEYSLLDTETIEQEFHNLSQQNDKPTYEALLGKPDTYNPTEHMHNANDLYGLNPVVYAINALRDTIAVGDRSRLSYVFKKLNDIIAEIDKRQSNNNEDILQQVQQKLTELTNLVNDKLSKRDDQNEHFDIDATPECSGVHATDVQQTVNIYHIDNKDPSSQEILFTSKPNLKGSVLNMVNTNGSGSIAQIAVGDHSLYYRRKFDINAPWDYSGISSNGQWQQIAIRNHNTMGIQGNPNGHWKNCSYYLYDETRTKMWEIQASWGEAPSSISDSDLVFFLVNTDPYRGAVYGSSGVQTYYKLKGNKKGKNYFIATTEDGVFPGAIVEPYLDGKPHYGYLLCNGANVKTADYPELAKYLGKSDTYFNLPTINRNGKTMLIKY